MQTTKRSLLRFCVLAAFAVSHVASAAISDSLVSYWSFDETSGAIAGDSTTNANHGLLNSFPADNSQWVTGRIGRALQFRGSSPGDYVRVPNYPKPATDITVAGWVWADARPAWASIAKNWGSSQPGQFHFGLTSSAGDLSCYVTTVSGTQVSTRENTPIPLGSWQHVAFTADGTRLRIFRNAAEVGSVAYSGGLKLPTINALGIGVKLNDAGTVPDSGSPGYWSGKIDDLGIWSRALNSAEISALVAAGLQGRSLTNAENAPVITGSGVRISEFMAGNQNTLEDDFGDSSDWIEIHNDTLATVNLAGWHLTDEASQPAQWTFPSTNLPAGAFLIVFASGRDRRVPGAPLHTDFKLAEAGEYLALVRPDGSIATQFAPQFLLQINDVSFGFGIETSSTKLLTTGAVGRVLVPVNGSLGTGWTTNGFSDAAWRPATNGIGYDIGTSNQGASFASDVLGNAPLGYWRLRETGGGWITNNGTLSPVGNGQLSGGVTLGVVGPRPPTFLGLESSNSAAHFDGLNGLIEADYTPDLNPSGPFTVECWVRPAWTSSNACPLSSQTYSDFSRAGYVFYQNNQSGVNQWEFRLGDAGGYVSVAAGGAVQTNTWQHLAGVYNGTNALLYVNGSPMASAPLSRAFAANQSQRFRLGAGGGGNYPYNGDLDEVAVCNRALTAAEIAQRYQRAMGGGTTTNFHFTGLIQTDLRSEMYGSNATAFFRLPFALTNAASVNQLTLRLKYNDGFAAHLNGVAVASDNAPFPPNWNSAALAGRAASDGLQFAEFDLSGWRNLLQEGTNVLAIQGLNFGDSSADFLVLAELEAATAGQYAFDPHYFTVPTPGFANGVGTHDLGPIISLAGHLPDVPGTNDSLTITCRVMNAFAPTTGLTLNWRVMYGAITVAPMFDDGQHSDGAVGDGIYGAILTNHIGTNWTYTAGQMVRWFITAMDSASHTSRWPLFQSPVNSAEYLGTVVQPDAVTTSALPVLHWFVENSSAANTDAGTRCSVFYNGHFYDNLGVRIRGGTARGWPKKSYKFDMNSGEKLFVRPDLPWVSAFDLNATYTDKSYVRSVLAAEHQRDAGLPSPDEFLLHVRRNGQFHSVAIYVEQPNEDFLRRQGLDPEGAFYKAQGNPLGTYEKKTRLYEDNSDLQALLNGLNLTGANLENFLFDNVNLANVVNFMATMAVTQNIDASDKNHFLHRDTGGTREWRILPWDLDLTFGPDYLNTDTIVFNLCDTSAPHCPSHPFIGARPYLLHSGKYQRLFEAVINTPRARQMLLRRVRTLTDRFLATNYFQDRIEQLFPRLEPDVQLDHALWGANAHFPGQTYTLRQALDRVKNEYLAPRLPFLAGTSIPGIGSAMPQSQPANSSIIIGAIDPNPAGGNQDEEYVQLVNTNTFAVDLSGWKLGGAVQLSFASGTVIPAGGMLYASPNAAAFRARTSGPSGGQGLFVHGNYDGRLNAWGESLTLTDTSGRLVSSNSYAGNPSPAQRFLRITEIMYHPTPLPGNTNDAQRFESIELKNISPSATLDLTGVKFTDGILFDFTVGTVTNLAPGQTVLVVRDLDAFSARYSVPPGSVAGQYTGALDNAGENLRLDDAVGEKILEFTYDNHWYPITDGLGFSLVIVNENAPWNTWGSKASWRASGQLNGSPGATDPSPPSLPPVLVNEALTHSDPETDWIELFNQSTTNADLGGWFLTDDFYTPKKYRIPAGTHIPPRGYIVFSGATSFEPGANGFRLSEYGEPLYLFSGDDSTNLTGYAHGFDFDAAPNSVSFGRYVNSQGQEDFVLQSASTPGTNNALPRVGPVVISEIMYHPPDLANSVNDELNEFIELQNIAGTNVPLYSLNAATNTWRLRNAVDFDFPTNVNLAGNALLLVVGFDPATNAAQLDSFRARHAAPTNVPLFGPWKGKLDNAGETIELQAADKPDMTPTNVIVPYVRIDKVAYQDTAPWPTNADGLGDSLHRRVRSAYGNEPTNWVAIAPTAGQPDVESPAITSITRNGDSIVVSLTTVAGFTYLLEYKDDLSDAEWHPIPPPMAALGDIVTLTDTNATVTRRFYRIRVP